MGERVCVIVLGAFNIQQAAANQASDEEAEEVALYCFSSRMVLVS